MNREEIKPPLFVAVAYDETEYWDEGIRSRVKKVYGIYMIDISRIYHLCSLQGSFEAEFLYNEFVGLSDEASETGILTLENGEEKDLLDLELESGGERIRYFNESKLMVLDTVELNESEIAELQNDPDDEYYRQVWDEVHEGFRQNWVTTYGHNGTFTDPEQLYREYLERFRAVVEPYNE